MALIPLKMKILNYPNENILANINFYAKSYDASQSYNFKFKYMEMWDVTNKLVIIYGIAAGMKYLHSHNILHRDLKPFNVITDCYLTPEIRGFDLAIMIDSKDKKIIMDEIKGTAAYLAPEVYLKREYSEKSDVNYLPKSRPINFFNTIEFFEFFSENFE